MLVSPPISSSKTTRHLPSLLFVKSTKPVAAICFHWDMLHYSWTVDISRAVCSAQSLCTRNGNPGTTCVLFLLIPEQQIIHKKQISIRKHIYSMLIAYSHNTTAVLLCFPRKQILFWIIFVFALNVILEETTGGTC